MGSVAMSQPTRSSRIGGALTVGAALLLLACPPRVLAAENAPPVSSEEAAWQTLEGSYRSAVSEVDAESARQRKELEAEQETLWGTIAANERELATLEAQIASRERLLARVDTRQLLGVSGTLAFVVLLVHLLV